MIILVNIVAPNLRGSFKNVVSEVCAEECGKKKVRRSKCDTWWWNDWLKEAVSRRKGGHKAICGNRSEEIKSRNKSLKNKVVNAVSQAMRIR